MNQLNEVLVSAIFFYRRFFFILGKASSFEEEDGTGTGRNEIRIKLGRGDLGSQFTCQGENDAIEGDPMTAIVNIDVNRKYYDNNNNNDWSRLDQESYPRSKVTLVIC